MTRSQIPSFILLMCMLLIPAAASAETLDMPEQGITMETPEGWHMTLKGGNIAFRTEDNLVNVQLMSVDKKAADISMEAALKAFASSSDDAKIEEPVEKPLNGMKGLYVTAAGKKGKVTLVTSMGMVETPSGKILFIQIIAADKLGDKHQPAVKKLMQSIKPLGK